MLEGREMRTETAIDTVTLQCNFNHEDKCDSAKDDILELLKKYNYYSEDDSEVQYRYKTVATIEQASYSYVKKNKKKANVVWYLSIKLAGLKRYNTYLDIAATNCLLIIASYFNTKKLAMKITQLDVALNIFTKFENVLSLCTKRLPKADYYKANEEQKYLTTQYFVKYDSKEQKNRATTHACLYDKTVKHDLAFKLTRFEISFSKKFLKKNGLNVGSIYNEFKRYHVLYMPNKKKKQELMDQYDAKDVLRQKDIKELKLNWNRLDIDINVLIDFAIRLYRVDDITLESYIIR